MRICPNCGKVYPNDLFFCLDDGTRLRERSDEVDPNAPTEAAAYGIDHSLPTEVLPSVTPTPVTIREFPVQPVMAAIAGEPSRRPGLLYVAIGALGVVCLVLLGALVLTNRGLILGANGNPQNVNARAPSPTPSIASVAAVPATSVATPSPIPTKSTQKGPMPLDASGNWNGTWSTASGTLFGFELALTAVGAYALDGSIRWTMHKTTRPDKADKVGLSATEYVRGTFDPDTGVVELTGYSKDDPNDVLVMVDVYKLQISSDGRKLTGAARNGGKWNGKVNLAR